MKMISSGLAIAALVVLVGCASTGGGTQEKKSDAAPPAPKSMTQTPPAPSTPSAPSAEPALQASKDMGTVVFFRESKFAGAAVSFKVREGDTELGKLSSGTYFIANLPRGPHEFTVHSEAKDVLNLEVEAGESYYIQGSISMGLMVGRPNLAPSDEATFNSMKAKLKDSGAPKAARK